MERMDNVMNVREAELREYLKINHEEMALLNNRNNKLEEENRDLVEKIEKLLWEKIKLEEENRSLELEKRNREVESEDLKMRLREKLPLALLKEYMEKFE